MNIEAKNLYIEVRPNGFNEWGYHIVISERIFGFFDFEIGRVSNEKSLDSFIEAYSKLNGKKL